MASRNSARGHRHCVVFFLAFFLTTLAPAWAQTVSHYTEHSFVQRLAWVGDEYAMRYEVIIEREREEEGEYNSVLREFTDAFFIEVSLPPGKYRYQVIPYDYLDQPVLASEWMHFEVLPGSEILSTEEHEIITANPGDETDRAETIISAAPEAEPSERVETEENAEHQSQFNIYAGAARIPLLPVFGENLPPYGVGVRLGIVSAKQSFLSPGMELVASWRPCGVGGQKAQSLTFDFNFLVQTRFPGGRAALNFRLGEGSLFLPGIHPAVPIADRFSVHANLGVSFLWLLLKNFYMEAGIDYLQFLTKGYFGFFRPWIGTGLRF
jgi:hypothetical protein